MFKLTRRKFITASLLGGLGAYISQRGLRYPRMGFEHRPRPSQLALPSLLIDLNHAIYLQADEETGIAIRAVAPEPTLHIKSRAKTRTKFFVQNLSSDAILSVVGKSRSPVHEVINGINRSIEIAFDGEDEVQLSWQLPEQDGLLFAVIGDTGAGLELEWLLQRADALQAKFLLHLGDFNYAAGEYDRAIELFNSATLPCYVSIGNHDYNASGLIYEQFINQIGPMNQTFSFAGTRFANIDSAADFFPASSGQRGLLFDELLSDTADYSDQVFFTHRPFYDVREGQDHVIGGIGEIDWLHRKIMQVGCDTLLTGHVHHSAETELDGLKQWTVGEGLGFEDILQRKQIAQLLTGQIEKGKKVIYRWEKINMPWAAHRSPTHEIKLRRDHPADALNWYRELIKPKKKSVALTPR